MKVFLLTLLLTVPACSIVDPIVDPIPVPAPIIVPAQTAPEARTAYVLLSEQYGAAIDTAYTLRSKSLLTDAQWLEVVRSQKSVSVSESKLRGMLDAWEGAGGGINLKPAEWDLHVGIIQSEIRAIDAVSENGGNGGVR